LRQKVRLKYGKSSGFGLDCNIQDGEITQNNTKPHKTKGKKVHFFIHYRENNFFLKKTDDICFFL